MQPLIDADIIQYEIGFAAEANWKHMHEGVDKEWLLANPPPFSLVEETLVNRISNICEVVEATAPPILYFTGEDNFRFKIATKQPYKNRAGYKPYHYKNIKAYLEAFYDCREERGYEADDLMAIEQTSRGCSSETIICSRDKDLRQVGGWHYGWELAKQAQFGPCYVDGYGSLEVSEDRKNIRGVGDKFFFAQCIMGDTVDSIPGLPSMGPAAAFNIVEGTNTYEEGLEAVREAYRQFYGSLIVGDEALTEQARLLWLVRERNKMWSLF